MAAKAPEVTCAGTKTSKVPTRVKLLLYFYFYFVPGVYTIYVRSDFSYLLLSQCFEGYLGNFSCLI